MRQLSSILESIRPLSFSWLNGILFGFFLIYHLFTLPISPLPWFDEVAFASITHNVMSIGKMIWPEVSEQEEFLAYGPVYFYVQHLLMKLLGFGIYSFRLLNLLSGLGLVAILYFMLRHLRFGSYWALLMATLLLFDVIFNQNLHSGRMDLFSFFLGVISYVIFYFPLKNKLLQIYLSPALSGVVFSLAYLSTPRSIYLISGFATLFIYQSLTRGYNVVLRYMFMAFIVCIIVGSWILTKFDSISNYISYYLDDPIISQHIGEFSLVRYFHHWPITILVLLSFVFWIAKWNSTIFKELFICTTAIILSFTFLVKEIGPYSAMLMPCYYLLVIITIFQLKDNVRMLMHLSLIAVLIVNITIFVFKSSLIINGISHRAYWQVNQEISLLIPKGSKVVSDYRYFYSVIRGGNEFRMLRSGRSNIKDRTEYYINDYRASYIIVADTTEINSANMLKSIRTIVKLERVGSILPHTSLEGSDIYNWLKEFGFLIDNSYSGHVIRINMGENM